MSGTIEIILLIIAIALCTSGVVLLALMYREVCNKQNNGSDGF